MTINAAQINQELLPQLLRELADVVGLHAALQLAEAYPGIPLYIPATPKPDHAIAKLIGFEGLKKLSEVYGLEQLRMPNTAVRKIRHQLVHELNRQNLSKSKIALSLGYTVRRVEQLISESCANEEPATNHQTDLFTERK